MTAHPSTTTLIQRVNGLVGRYTGLSADRLRQAKDHRAEASYLYGAAAAFEVVATELWEALGKHGAVPGIAWGPRPSALDEQREDAPSTATDGLRLVPHGDAVAGHSPDEGESP
jgi:hypothetical protein